jgi:hypothetical protein
MSMVIHKEGLPFTHYLEVRGKSDKEISREKLSEFAYEKIKEIDNYWHPDMELIYSKDKIIKVGIFVSASLNNETVISEAKKWVIKHLNDKVSGIFLDSLMIKTIYDMGLSTPFKEEVIRI